MLTPWKKSYDHPRQHIKKHRHCFANKGPFLVKAMVFPVVMYRCESWTIKKTEFSVFFRKLKNWCFCTVLLGKTLEIPLYSKEVQPVHPKWNQSWIFIGRTDAEAETPILWPAVMKNWLIWKGPVGGKDWRQEEKGTTQDETVGWHHWHDERKFE